MRIALDRRTRRLGRALILGGDPTRVLRLSERGATLLDDLLAGRASGTAAAALSRRLVDAGIAHAVRPADGELPAMTVVVPVRDDAAALDACLGALHGMDVVVVDDGSADPVAVGEIAAHHDVHVVWHDAPRGPAAARNTGLLQVRTPLVAFVDADVRVSAHALRTLSRWFSDARISAAAPRIRPAPAPPTALQRFLAARSPLDLGPEPALVRAQGRVGYVPSAVLVCRRAALGMGFDEQLRYGEDVDLVWRMVDAGGAVRYDPDVVAHHREPTTWWAALGRRHRYGTSAGPLSRRHAGRLAPAVTTPLPAVTAALVLARRNGAASVTGVGAVGLVARRLTRAGVPGPEAVRVAARTVGSSLLALGRSVTQLGAPVTLGAGPGRAAVLLAAAPFAERRRRHPDLDPLRWTLACLADDIAYGLGVWRGALRTRTLGPLLPRVHG